MVILSVHAFSGNRTLELGVTGSILLLIASQRLTLKEGLNYGSKYEAGLF